MKAPGMTPSPIPETKPLRFDIINPSDPYTMEAVDLKTAAVAVCLFGDGKYPLQGLDESAGLSVPPFLLGGHDEWFTAQFGANFEAITKQAIAQCDNLASALESVKLESDRRSSMNDIGTRAKGLAKAIRAKAAEAAQQEKP